MSQLGEHQGRRCLRGLACACAHGGQVGLAVAWCSHASVYHCAHSEQPGRSDRRRGRPVRRGAWTGAAARRTATRRRTPPSARRPHCTRSSRWEAAAAVDVPGLVCPAARRRPRRWPARLTRGGGEWPRALHRPPRRPRRSLRRCCCWQRAARRVVHPASIPAPVPLAAARAAAWVAAAAGVAAAASVEMRGGCSREAAPTLPGLCALGRHSSRRPPPRGSCPSIGNGGLRRGERRENTRDRCVSVA